MFQHVMHHVFINFLLFCYRGLLSARSLLGAIERAEDQLSPSLVAVYLFNRIKRFG